MNDQQQRALHDYRALMRLLAKDSTLSDAQLARLSLAQEVLGLDEQDTEADLEALHRHDDLAEALEGPRTRYTECEQTVRETDSEIAAYVEQLEASQRRRHEAQECLEATEAAMSELLNLERENPRIFGSGDH